MALEPQLLIEGSFSPEDIVLSISDSPLRYYEPEVKAKLELLWQEKLRDSERRGYKVWNSQSYALKDAEVVDNILHLTIGLVEYKYQAGIMRLIEDGELSKDFATRLMYSGLLIRSSDAKWVFGIGASHVYVGEIKYVGGSYSKDEYVLSDGNSLFNGALIELKEELGVTKDQVSSIHLRRVYATPRGMRSFIFIVELNITADAIQEIFHSRTDQELSDIRILETEEAIKTISQLEGSRGLVADLLY